LSIAFSGIPPHCSSSRSQHEQGHLAKLRLTGKLGRTLKGLTLGMWGYGNIGQRGAQFGNVFGMNMLV